MSEVISAGSNYVRFKGSDPREGDGLPPGSKVSVKVEKVCIDVAGNFGPESYIVGEDLETGERVQVKLYTASKRLVQACQSRILPGVSVLHLEYLGEKVNERTKKKFKAFNLTADDLAPKGMSVLPENVKAAAETLGADVSFDPKKLS